MQKHSQELELALEVTDQVHHIPRANKKVMKTIFLHQTKMLEHQNPEVKFSPQGPRVRGSQPWAGTARLRRHGVTNYITAVNSPRRAGNLCSLQSTVLRKGCAAIPFQVIAQPQGMFSGLPKDSNTISRNAQSVLRRPDV